MDHKLDNTWCYGEDLLISGVESLFQGWKKASTEMIDKLWNGSAERWQAANRQIQVASVNLADILRARTSI
jgi:hypothetical protein